VGVGDVGDATLWQKVGVLEGQIFGSWLGARAPCKRDGRGALPYVGMTKHVNHHMHIAIVIRRVAWIRLYLLGFFSKYVVVIAFAPSYIEPHSLPRYPPSTIRHCLGLRVPLRGSLAATNHLTLIDCPMDKVITLRVYLIPSVGSLPIVCLNPFEPNLVFPLFCPFVYYPMSSLKKEIVPMPYVPYFSSEGYVDRTVDHGADSVGKPVR